MRIGVVFPQTEIGTDAAVIGEYSQAAEQLSYHHIFWRMTMFWVPIRRAGPVGGHPTHIKAHFTSRSFFSLIWQD